MSTRKSRGIKGAKPKAQAVNSSSSKKKSNNFIASFSRMIFLVVAILFGVFIIYSALSEKDVTNDFIKDNLPRLLTLEALLFGVMTAGFIFSAFKLLFKLAEKKYDYLVFGLVFLAISCNFGVSFDKNIGSFGDNASYIINAKSLLDRGAPYKLDNVNEQFDSKAALGLPAMLMPIVAFWGMDVVKMKALVFILGCLSLFFFFLAFKKRIGTYAAAIIVILLGTYPMVIYNTSYVMTEVPFLFTLSVTMYVAFCLMDATTTKRSIILGITTAILAIICYMTRAVGIGTIVAIMTWLFVWIPWVDVIEKKVKLLETLAFRKFALVTLIMGVFVMGWQFRSIGTTAKVNEEGTKEVVKNQSQAESFADRNLADNFKRNYNLCAPLWAQQIFSKKLSRWYLTLGENGKKKIKTMKNGKGLALFNFFIFATLVVGMIRRRLAAFIFFFILLVTLTGSLSNRHIIFSRYIIVILPFLVYIILDFFIHGSRFLSERSQTPIPAIMGVILAIIFSFVMLSHNLSGAAFNAQRQNAGSAYTLGFENFIECAKWVKDNLPDDAVVASRKPRLFYIASERKSVVTAWSNSPDYNKEIGDAIIGRMRNKGCKYLVLDTFNTTSKRVVRPMIKNNPDLFRPIHKVGKRNEVLVYEFSG